MSKVITIRLTMDESKHLNEIIDKLPEHLNCPSCSKPWPIKRTKTKVCGVRVSKETHKSLKKAHINSEAIQAIIHHLYGFCSVCKRKK